MAKVPGFLRRRERIDEAELELTQVRTLARLAEMFGGTAASVEAPADLPAATEQPRAAQAQAPGDPDPAIPTGRRGTSRRPPVIELPAHLVGVMAEPERPDVEAPPEPHAATMVGVMAGRGPADTVGPTDGWRSRADAYVLAVAFGAARGPIPGRGADSAVRIETRRSDAIQPVPADESVDLRGEGPRAVQQASGPVLRKLRANRPRPASGPRS
jgi:hypothetical protein